MAEYLADPGDKRKVSAHYAWSKKHNTFAECVPLTTVAWHAGKSRYGLRGNCNDFSIGVELPGPFGGPIGDYVMGELDKLMEIIKAECSSITECCGHCHVSPDRRKDPGKEFKMREFCKKHNLKCIF